MQEQTWGNILGLNDEKSGYEPANEAPTNTSYSMYVYDTPVHYNGGRLRLRFNLIDKSSYGSVKVCLLSRFSTYGNKYKIKAVADVPVNIGNNIVVIPNLYPQEGDYVGVALYDVQWTYSNDALISPADIRDTHFLFSDFSLEEGALVSNLLAKVSRSEDIGLELIGCQSIETQSYVKDKYLEGLSDYIDYTLNAGIRLGSTPATIAYFCKYNFINNKIYGARCAKGTTNSNIEFFKINEVTLDITLIQAFTPPENTVYGDLLEVIFDTPVVLAPNETLGVKNNLLYRSTITYTGSSVIDIDDKKGNIPIFSIGIYDNGLKRIIRNADWELGVQWITSKYKVDAALDFMNDVHKPLLMESNGYYALSSSDKQYSWPLNSVACRGDRFYRKTCQWMFSLRYCPYAEIFDTVILRLVNLSKSPLEIDFYIYETVGDFIPSWQPKALTDWSAFKCLYSKQNAKTLTANFNSFVEFNLPEDIHTHPNKAYFFRVKAILNREENTPGKIGIADYAFPVNPNTWQPKGYWSDDTSDNFLERIYGKLIFAIWHSIKGKCVYIDETINTRAVINRNKPILNSSNDFVHYAVEGMCMSFDESSVIRWNDYKANYIYGVEYRACSKLTDKFIKFIKFNKDTREVELIEQVDTTNMETFSLQTHFFDSPVILADNEVFAIQGSYYIILMSYNNYSNPELNNFLYSPGMFTYVPGNQVYTQPDTQYLLLYNLIADENALNKLLENNSNKRSVSEIPTKVLYNKDFTKNTEGNSEILLNSVGEFTENGILVNKNTGLVRLNKYYSLGCRSIRFLMKFSANAIVMFSTDQAPAKGFRLNVAEKKLYAVAKTTTFINVDFLNTDHEYLIEVYRLYQTQKAEITDMQTNEKAEISITYDIQYTEENITTSANTNNVSLQHDYYTFGLDSSSPTNSNILVKNIVTLCEKDDFNLLIYGDSITEPEGYFAIDEFNKAWTQLIINHVDGKAMSSGRGATTIHQILTRIVNELPFVKSKYVMITIGTNGGNTEGNLSQLVEYIMSCGSIPILNNIPCDQDNSQVGTNALIEQIRKKYGIKGCRFDFATSLNGDGKELDATTMFEEHYSDSTKVFRHHPNVKGSMKMFLQTLIDIPEIYG